MIVLSNERMAFELVRCFAPRRYPVEFASGPITAMVSCLLRADVLLSPTAAAAAPGAGQGSEPRLSMTIDCLAACKKHRFRFNLAPVSPEAVMAHDRSACEIGAGRGVVSPLGSAASPLHPSLVHLAGFLYTAVHATRDAGVVDRLAVRSS
jgi:hypothetical protein